MAESLDLYHDDAGSRVVLRTPSNILTETFSTPRAAQDRFNDLAGMLLDNGGMLTEVVDYTTEDAKKLAAIMDRVGK